MFSENLLCLNSILIVEYTIEKEIQLFLFSSSTQKTYHYLILGSVLKPEKGIVVATRSWPGIDEAIADLDYRYYNGYPMRIL